MRQLANGPLQFEITLILGTFAHMLIEQKSNADPHIPKDIVEAGLEYNDGVPPRS